MTKDIIYNENELSIAANSIVTYADFLTRCIADYTAILKDIQDKGIKDDLITSKLTELTSSLAPYATAIYDDGKEVSSNVNKSISDVVSVDNFQFPSDVTSTIGTLLAKFLL